MGFRLQSFHGIHRGSSKYWPTLQFPSAVDSRVGWLLLSEGKGHTFESCRVRQFDRARYHALPAAAPVSRMIPASCGSPGREPRNPARDVGPEILVLRSEPTNERRLLVPHDKRVEGEPHQHTVPKKALVAEQDRLAQNDGDKGNVNRIAHIAIETRHHEVLRRCDRRRRAQSLQRKACKRVDKPG